MSSSMGNMSGRNASPVQNPNPETWQTTTTKIATAKVDPSRVDIRTYLDSHGYRLGDILGEGSYSKVRTCTRYSNIDGKYMYKLACKIIDKCRASDDFVTKFLPRELKIFVQLNHANIVRVWDIVQQRDKVYIFMDFCQGGDLLELVKRRGLISENRSRHYFRQIVSALRYLHQMDIAHRDLKCENILMTLNDQIKISDFGFARFCHNAEGKRILSNTYCGSAAYAAPEILLGTDYNPKLYDCWSIGCVLFIMITGHMPFDESDIPKMLKYQMERKLTFPQHHQELSMAAKLLIRRLLEPDVTRRGNIEVAANHEWTRLQPNSLQPYRSSNPCDGDGNLSSLSSPRSGTASCDSGNSSPRGGIDLPQTPCSRDDESCQDQETSSSSASPRKRYPIKSGGTTHHERRRYVGSRSGNPEESLGPSPPSRVPRSGTAKVGHFTGTASAINSGNRTTPPRRR